MKAVMKLVKYSLPYFFIALVRLIHKPLDEKYIVEKLGCGCTEGFNANTFSFILFTFVAVISTWVLSSNSRKIAKADWKASYMISGMGVILLSYFFVILTSRWK